MFNILLIIMFVLSIIFICDYFINYNKNAIMIKKVPGFKHNFLIGNALEIIVSPVELFALGRKYANKFNGIYSFYSCTLGAVNIYNPEDIEIVMTSMKHHEKSNVYRMLRPWLRDGLLLSNGSKWHSRRKILTPAFHFNVLGQYYKVLQTNSRRLVETLEKASGNSENIAALISDHTLNTVCETVMGIQLNNKESEDGRSYKNAIQGVISGLLYRFIRVYLYFDTIFYLTKPGKEQWKYISIIHKFTESVIKRRKKAIINNEVELDEASEDTQCTNKKKNLAMLDLLIRAENEGSIDTIGIQEEVDTFMFEGHDTTATGLSYFLLSVANEEDIQEKIVNELRDIFGDTKRTATLEDLNKMQYLERCIKETLRLYPPVPFMSRKLGETVKLSNYTVPEGTWCHIHVFDLHRRPEIFENPLEFNPDRFLPENCAGRHRFAYIPFSAGPRNCIVIILAVTHQLINNNEKARLIRKIPGPKDYFLIGNAWHAMVTPVELFNLAREYAAKFNRLYRFYAYPHVSVNIYNPEDIEIVTVSMKHHEKSEIYKFLRPWLRDGLLLSNGKKWQQRRKILTHAFHFNILQQYFYILEESSQRLVENLKNQEGEQIDILSVISEYTLNSICESAMGTRLNDKTSTSGNAYKNAICNIGKITYKRLVTPYLYPDFIFNCTSWSKQQSDILSIIHNFTKTVIKERKQMVGDDKICTEDKVDSNNIYKKNKNYKAAMLDLLIAAEREGTIDDVGIQEEVDTFMFEGHDTTASGLAFFLVALANNPSIQEKVFEELREIYGDTNRATTLEDLNKMSYLERCIKESLRLYPPVHFISRRITETVQLSNYTVPEGTFCNIHIFDLHRRADLFEDPLKFDPDRFLPENSIGRHKFAYIPFSAGPRNCIGQKFAMMEMKLGLSAIFRNFEVLPVTLQSDLKMKCDLILKNSLPLYVKFVTRCNKTK